MQSFFGVHKFLECSLRNCVRLSIRNASIQATAAKTSADQRFVEINVSKCGDTTATPQQFKYPSIWLRDNCQCSSCFDAHSKSRTIDWTQFNFNNARPKSISIDKQLEVTWNDDHVSKYDIEWLIQRNFSPENRKRYVENHYLPTPILWSKDQFKMNEFQSIDVLESDQGLFEWIKALSLYGVVLIKNAPLTEDQCEKLINRIGFIRETHYGKIYYIRARPNAQNYAYTTNALQVHTDLPYYEYIPGTTVLHCIAQTKSPGAFNLLVDGFYVADLLKRKHPAEYKCLTETLVNWSDYGEENGIQFEKIVRSPIISLDVEGNVNRIRYNVPQRDTFFSIDVEQVDEWYAAMKLFIDYMYKEAVYFKTEPGDMLTFSNIRLLHGRTAYEDKEGNIRHLVGAYLDWDEIYSRLRVFLSKHQ